MSISKELNLEGELVKEACCKAHEGNRKWRYMQDKIKEWGRVNDLSTISRWSPKGSALIDKAYSGWADRGNARLSKYRRIRDDDYPDHFG